MPRNITEIFTEIVQIDSPTGHEEKMAMYLKNLLSSYGYSPTIDEHDNVFLQVDGEDEPIFLNAHIDTVEPGRGIIPTITDGIIRSQGETILGADNKTAVASIIWVLEKIANEKLATKPLDILFTTSEEAGNYGAIGFDQSKIRAKTGYVFDKEGAIGEILSASPFYARFDIELKGISSHAAYRENSTPVLDIAPQLMTEIEQLRSEEILINIGHISGGSVRNTVMGDLILSGEIRSFDKKDFEETIQTLREICTKHSGNITIADNLVVENPGYTHPEKTLKPIKDQIRKIIGAEPKITQTYGCSDANIFNKNPEKLRVFNLSSGGHDAHTTNEYVAIEELETLAQLILALTKPEANQI